MQNHNPMIRLFTLILCIALTNCATTNAPYYWLNQPEQTVSDAHGGWIDIRLRANRISGELIAISEESVFVANKSLHSVPSEEILSARLAVYNARPIAFSVVLGTLSTVSNGLIAIFTAPMWLIGGSLAASFHSYEPIVDYPKKPLSEFRPFARYPQGLPPSLERIVLRAKPANR